MGTPLLLRLAPNQRFDCMCCGRCCHRWHVALREREITELRERDWQGDPRVPVDTNPVTIIDGHPYLAHKTNGECIYFDPETKLCRLQTRFGYDAKPLGCRLFPFNPAAVLPGVVSCTVRFDCPAVQQNHGSPLTAHRDQIVKLSGEMGLTGDVKEAALGGLKPDVAARLAESFAELAASNANTDPAVGSIALLLAARHLRTHGENFLNDRKTMLEILPNLMTKFRERAAAQLEDAKPLGAMDRVLFHSWLANFMRRDEELLDQPHGRRVRRMLQFTAILFGHGNLHDLGAEHPSVPLGDVRLFSGNTLEPSSPAAWNCWRRFVDGRLRTLQFFGVALDGMGLFAGAQSLGTTFALMSAAAKVQAAAAGRTGGRLEAADVEYAVGAVDHAFGRSRLLRLRPQRFVAEWFGDPARFAAALRRLGVTPRNG